MTFELRAVPKPKRRRKSVKRTRTPLRKTRMRTRNAKRKGSAFPEMRDTAHCAWVVTETRCVGSGRRFKRAISPHDKDLLFGEWRHGCWGPNDPAHVGKHRAQGAADLGHVVKMCRALHDFYDQHRSQFTKATGITERELESIAAGNGLRYQERGGF